MVILRRLMEQGCNCLLHLLLFFFVHSQTIPFSYRREQTNTT
jgi:hypothetical protein